VKSSLFFNKLTIFPLNATVDIIFEVKSYRGAATGESLELVNMFPSPQGSKLRTPLIVMENFALSALPDKLQDALKQQVGVFDMILLLLCGVQPIRTVNEVKEAVTELVVKPVEHLRRHKGIYAGVLRGLQGFSRRVAAETARVTSEATRGIHYALNAATGMARQSEPLHRGAQPLTFGDAAERGMAELRGGVSGLRDIVRFSVSEGRYERLPLALLAPVDGAMRALTQLLIGARNELRPDVGRLEMRKYKAGGPDESERRDT